MKIEVEFVNGQAYPLCTCGGTTVCARHAFGPPSVACAPTPDLRPMPPLCEKCGWSHTTAMCLPALSPRISEADVDRIARRVVELLKANG